MTDGAKEIFVKEEDCNSVSQDSDLEKEEFLLKEVCQPGEKVKQSKTSQMKSTSEKYIPACQSPEMDSLPSSTFRKSSLLTNPD